MFVNRHLTDYANSPVNRPLLVKQNIVLPGYVNDNP